MNISVFELECKRCNHKWIPRKTQVRVCPKCHSPYWDKARSGSPGSDPLTAVLDEMVRRIVKECDPEKIILFGSYARGHAGPGSDVDLMVVTRHGETRRKVAGDLYHALGGLGVSKDIIVVRPEDVERYRHVVGTIIHPAVRDGKTLYERAA